ncbi:hypothetical protein [Streptomyces sp. Amel2xB2]|uniref:hypothetical protein n=1 Tax=Streptomyces sp. Amel2xB2 TaxID=1305829 RepID=UPI0015EBEC43|nr:hypothetical protein [Streptomyces sp. Amel2xB2]
MLRQGLLPRPPPLPCSTWNLDFCEMGVESCTARSSTPSPLKSPATGWEVVAYSSPASGRFTWPSSPGSPGCGPFGLPQSTRP